MNKKKQKEAKRLEAVRIREEEQSARVEAERLKQERLEAEEKRALEIQAGYNLYKSDPTAYYAAHPAAKPMGNYCPFAIINNQVFIAIARQLDGASLPIVLRLQSFHNHMYDILNAYVPCRYAQLGLPFEDAFFRLDGQVKWNPGVLGNEDRAKLHFLFCNEFARAIPVRQEGNPWSDEAQDVIYRRFIAMYSLAYHSAHWHAAVEAGRMLCNPEYNGIIPTLIGSDMILPLPDAWNFRGLIESEWGMTHSAINEIMDTISNLGKLSKDVVLSTLNNSIKKVRDLKDSDDPSLKKKPVCDELAAVGLLVEEVMEFVSTGKSDPNAPKTLSFINQLSYTTPFLQHIVELFIQQEKPRAARNTYQPLPTNINLEQVRDCFQGARYPGRTQTLSWWEKPLKLEDTSEEREALKRLNQLHKIVVLIGGNKSSDVRVHIGANSINSPESYADVFLCHMVLTRKPTAKGFQGMMNCVDHYFVNKVVYIGDYPNEQPILFSLDDNRTWRGQNPERMILLCEQFPNVYRNNISAAGYGGGKTTYFNVEGGGL